MSILTEKSFSKARWVLPDVPLAEAEKLARSYDVPEIIARLLISREIARDDVSGFLNPTLRDHFPDPFSMIGMEAMAQDLAQKIIAKEQIAIFGDFDVDGATSSAVLFRFLKACGVEAPIYIPDRLSEGYGPNLKALQSLKDRGATTVIMLDCGTTAFDIVAQGRSLGLDIYIFDHHEAEDRLPDAAHVINPKRQDDGSGLDVLAAVGVTFLACVAVNKVLRAEGFFDGRSEPPLKSWLDIVALGTVCDMVPLTGPNRLFVKVGLPMMAGTQNAGLRALLEVSAVKGEVTTSVCGFALGPRINAGSRVHEADLGARLLTSDDPEEVQNIAWTLEDCNSKRKSIQQAMEREAVEKVESLGLGQGAAIVVDDEGWHPGLSGLVAGRLKDKYAKPACVVTYAKTLDGVLEGRGSGRSIPGVHIADSFIAAKDAGLIVKGGGHAMAGGFTIVPEKLHAFRDFLMTHVEGQVRDGQAHVETVIDGILSVPGVQLDLIRLLEEGFGPFGQAHDEPVFLLRNVRVYSADVMGASHIRLMLGDWEGGTRLKAVAFGAVGTDMGDAFLKHGTRSFDVVGRLKINSWQGRENPEMHIQDAVFSDVAQADLRAQA